MSFTLFFAGAEAPVSADFLFDEAVTAQCVSYYEWMKRRKSTNLREYFDTSTKLCVTPGVSKRMDLDWKAFCSKYQDFVLDNVDDIELALEVDSENCPHHERFELRIALSGLGRKLVVFPTDQAQLTFLENYTIGLTARSAKEIKWTGKSPVHLVNTTSAKLVTATSAQSATTYAWLSPRRYGEAWLFDGAKMVHYPSDQLGALERHRKDMAALDIDATKALAGDVETLQKLAVRSLQLWAERLARKQPDPPKLELVVGGFTAPSRPTAPDGSSSREVIPVFRAEDPDQGALGFSSAVLRECDSCYLAARCPRHTPGSPCGYEIPVRIENRDDWQRACQALLEMQYQRVTFGFFSEQVEGQPLKKGLGDEMDRFYRMLKETKELERTDLPDTHRGVLQQIFGSTLEAPALGETDGHEEGVEVVVEDGEILVPVDASDEEEEGLPEDD